MAQNTQSKEVAAEDNRANEGEDGALLTLLVPALRRAILNRIRLWIVFNGNKRLIEPYRLWHQRDGTVLLEGYQISGGSAWGTMGDSNFRPSPLGGFEAWINFPVEAIEVLSVGGGPFTPRDDYAPVPDRSLGVIIVQLDEPEDEEPDTEPAQDP